MSVTVSMIWLSMSSSWGIDMTVSVGFRDDGSGIGVEGIGGSDRNFDGSRGTHRPVGFPIVVVTESHPRPLSIRAPSMVPEINPSTKYAVLLLVCIFKRNIPLERNDTALFGNGYNLSHNARLVQKRHPTIVGSNIPHSPKTTLQLDNPLQIFIFILIIHNDLSEFIKMPLLLQYATPFSSFRQFPIKMQRHNSGKCTTSFHTSRGEGVPFGIIIIDI